MRQLGMIANCLLCDTYFMICVDYIHPQELTKKEKDKKFIEIQKRLTEKSDFQACPTCVELCYDVKFQDFMSQERDTILSPAVPVMFIDPKDVHRHKTTIKIENPKINEFSIYQQDPNVQEEKSYDEVEIEEIDDGIPIYINMSETLKPKWTLCFGLGPTRIELDNSKSGRIYKPYLKQFGLDGVAYKNTKNLTTQDFQMMNEKILRCYQKVKRNFVHQFDDELKSLKPLYDNWDKIEEKVEHALKTK